MDNTNLNEKAVEETNQEPEFVPAKAYKEQQNDMFRYKNKLKETEAMLNQLKAEKEASEREQLVQSEQWKELYQREQKEKSELLSTRAKEQEQFISFHKKNAVLKEIGGFKKDEYSNFINVNSIEVDENGNVTQESLVKEANRIKQAYPELLKGVTVNNLPNEAAKPGTPAGVDYNNLSQAEKLKIKLSLMNK